MSVVFSQCRTWRYRLERHVSFNLGILAVIGVNPSYASETKNDPTVRKDMGFADRLGYGALIKGNMFGFVSTDVRGPVTAEDPVGPDNDRHLEAIGRRADMIIVAWGASAKLPPRLRDRWRDVVSDQFKGRTLHCLDVCKDGQPMHPLYIPYSKVPQIWIPPP